MRWLIRVPIIVFFLASAIITVSFFYEVTFGYGRTGWTHVLVGCGFMLLGVLFYLFYKFIDKLGERIKGNKLNK